MQKFIPVALFIATFILVLKAAILFTSESESIDWLDINPKALLISGGIGAFVVALYKILVAKVKMALLLLIIVGLILLFNIYLKS